MDKNSQLTSLTTKDLKVDASSSIKETTTDYSMVASATAKIKSPKVAIGTDGIELLDELVQLVEALSKVVVVSPVGPCAPFGSSGQWPDVDKIKAKITTIKGSL